MNKSIIFLLVISLISCGTKKNEKIDADLIEKLRIISIDKDKKESIADSLYKVKDFKNVIKEYSILIEIDSTKGVYYYRRGYSYGQFYKFNLAISDFKKSIDYGYRKHDSYYSVAVIYHEVFDEDSTAINYLNQALLEDSTSNLARKLLLKIETGDVKNI
jgi:tetratricopeptide (TPR) repeat protein